MTYEDYAITVTVMIITNLFKCSPESKVSDMAGSHTFSFDRVFGPNVIQQDIFNEVAKPVVDGNHAY